MNYDNKFIRPSLYDLTGENLSNIWMQPKDQEDKQLYDRQNENLHFVIENLGMGIC